MMTKLTERVTGMRRLCDSVRAAVLPHALPILRQHTIRRVLMLVTVDDVPLPQQHDYVDRDRTLRLHFQSVGTEAADLFPDFVFGGWWHIGLHDFDAFANAISTASEVPPWRPQALWIGNTDMSPRRAQLVTMSQAHPSRIHARAMQWAHARGNVTEATGERAATDGWISLPQHGEWRYLIDVEGMGWSGRLKLLPFTRRPLLIQDGLRRPYWDWSSAMLRPHVHYLPVKRDLSDLVEQIEWLDNHPADATRLANAAFELATTQFTFAAAVRHGANLTLARLAAAIPPPAPPARASRWERRLQHSKQPEMTATRVGEMAELPAAPVPVVEDGADSCLHTDPPVDDPVLSLQSRLDDPVLSLQSRVRAQEEADALVAAESAAVRAAASHPTVYAYRGQRIAVHPLSNSMPDYHFVRHVPAKVRAFAVNIPGNTTTYAFGDEQSYLDDYRGALFGVTRKKTGWDAARHLEIMASGCVPIFVDLSGVPAQTLALYPKASLAAAASLPGVTVRAHATGRTDPRWYLDPAAFSIEPRVFNASAYLRLAAHVLAHARQHLSSSGMAAHVLSIMGLDTRAAAPLLFVTHCSSDFTGDSLLYGFKALLGAASVVDVAFDTDGAAHPWCRAEARTQRKKAYLYDTSVDYAHDAENRTTPSRFCIGGRHPDSPSIHRDGIEERIARHEFGAIVYGSAARTVALLPLASRYYARERVGLVYGEDIPLPLGDGLPMEGVQRHAGAAPTVPSMAETSQWGVVFSRELFDTPADKPWTVQTMMTPGVADRVERGWHQPVWWALD